MSRFNGRMSPVGDKKDGRKNKGILRAYRERQRILAEVRQENIDPRHMKCARLRSTYNPKTGKREPWTKFPHHRLAWEEMVNAHLTSGKVSA